MPFTFRKTVRLGPLRLNFGKRGFTSWGVQLGRLRWNSKRGVSADLPGPVNWRER